MPVRVEVTCEVDPEMRHAVDEHEEMAIVIHDCRRPQGAYLVGPKGPTVLQQWEAADQVVGVVALAEDLEEEVVVMELHEEEEMVVVMRRDQEVGAAGVTRDQPVYLLPSVTTAVWLE